MASLSYVPSASNAAAGQITAEIQKLMRIVGTDKKPLYDPESVRAAVADQLAANRDLWTSAIASHVRFTIGRIAEGVDLASPSSSIRLPAAVATAAPTFPVNLDPDGFLGRPSEQQIRQIGADVQDLIERGHDVDAIETVIEQWTIAGYSAYVLAMMQFTDKKIANESQLREINKSLELSGFKPSIRSDFDKPQGPVAPQAGRI